MTNKLKIQIDPKYKLVEKSEEDYQLERIEAFLKRNKLKLEDLKKILELTLGESKN